jgi:hypothetical protein
MSKLKGKYATYVLEVEDILSVVYHPWIEEITEQDAIAAVAERRSYQGSLDRFLLIKDLQGINFNKGARDYLAGPEGIAGLLACDIVIDDWIVLATSSFLRFVQRPKLPTQIFISEAAARDWLRKCKNNRIVHAR